MPYSSVHEEVAERLAEYGGGPREWGLVSQEWVTPASGTGPAIRAAQYKGLAPATKPAIVRGKHRPSVFIPDVRSAVSAAYLRSPASPKSPTSPFSPLKAAVDRFYGAAAAPVRAGANAVRTVRKRYVLSTLTPFQPQTRGAAVELAEISPTHVVDRRNHAVDYFRSARNANARYTAYKEGEARKKLEIRTKSLPTQTTAAARLSKARMKLAALSVLQKMPGDAGHAAESDAAGAGGLAGGNNLLQRLAVQRLETGDVLRPRVRVIDVAENQGGVTHSRGAAIIKGRR